MKKNEKKNEKKEKGKMKNEKILLDQLISFLISYW